MKLFVKSIFIALCIALSPCSLQARRAVLIAHYGSSDDDTRALTIDKITDDIRAALPGMEVRQAYISPVVLRNLAHKGIYADSPTQALLRLVAEGYDSVYVQSSTIIDGAEMAEVRKAAEQTRPFFKEMAIGTPLCYTPQDCQQLVDILMQEPRDKDEAVIYVGHGNMLPSTATYCQLDYMMDVSAKPGYHVSTIEGYPTAQTTAAELACDKKIKRVKLMPLLLVCGNHTKNDIAKDFANVMQQAGYKPLTIMRGLGENPEVRALYVAKVLKLIAQEH